MITSPYRWRTLETPVGGFLLRLHDDGFISAHWMAMGDDDPEFDDPIDSRHDETILKDVSSRLARYFEGDATVDFSIVPTPRGAAFQQACWEACRQIPPGETLTYGELAEAAGSSMAARAAGQAMRRNPLPVIVPCHRVVGSGGRLHGYGGTTDCDSTALRIKRGLLALERKALVGAD